MSWSDFFTTNVSFATLSFFGFVVIGFCALIKDTLPDAIVRELGGLGGLLRVLAFAVGASVFLGGALQLLATCLVALFIFVNSGSIVAGDSKGQVADLMGAILFIAAGFFWAWTVGLPAIDNATSLSVEEFAKRRAAVLRWMTQWLIGVGLSMIILQLLPLLKLTPDLPNDSPWTAALLAFGMGFTWSVADYLRRCAVHGS